MLREHSFKIILSSFFVTIALPLSCGCVGLTLVPEFEIAHCAGLARNHLIKRAARLLALEERLCLRYPFVAELPGYFSDWTSGPFPAFTA